MISNLTADEEFILYGSLSVKTQEKLLDELCGMKGLIRPSETDSFCTVAEEGFMSQIIKSLALLKEDRMGSQTRTKIDAIIEEVEQLEYQMVNDEAYRREELYKVENSLR